MRDFQSRSQPKPVQVTVPPWERLRTLHEERDEQARLKYVAQLRANVAGLQDFRT